MNGDRPRPEFLIVDGAAGLTGRLLAFWGRVPVQQCTVQQHRNLLARTPERLHEVGSAEDIDMFRASTPGEFETRRRAFICNLHAAQ